MLYLLALFMHGRTFDVLEAVKISSPLSLPPSLSLSFHERVNDRDFDFFHRRRRQK